MRPLPPHALRRPKRDPAALSGPVAAASFVGSLVAPNTLSAAPYPMPGADAAAIRRRRR